MTSLSIVWDNPMLRSKSTSISGVLPIKSSRFKNWLCKIFYDFSGKRNKEVSKKDDQSKKIHSVEDVNSETEKEELEDEDTSTQGQQVRSVWWKNACYFACWIRKLLQGSC